MATKKITAEDNNQENIVPETNSADELLKRIEALEKQNKELLAKSQAPKTETITPVKESKLRSPLINKKVIIELIESPETSLHKDKHQATLLTGAAKSFAVPINQYGYLVDPLEEWERKYLEDVLGVNLNVRTLNTKDNPEANFWTSRRGMVVLRKNAKDIKSASITLNLNDPYQFILYKVALVCPRVAKTWKERYDRPGEYEFVIKDGEVEFVEELDNLSRETAVIDYLLANKNSKKKLFDLIRLYGIERVANQIKFTSSLEFMFNELWKVTKKPGQIEKLYSIIKLGEKDVSSRVFLADAVTVGLIEKRGTEYRLIGGDKIGNNEEEAINFIEDPRNQSTKLRIQMKIEQFYNIE